MLNTDIGRVATPADAAPIAALINAAYVVEAFFKIGNRTSGEEILGLMRTGRFLVLDLDGGLAGCVYVEVNARGRGRGAVPAVRLHGMELQVVNLRTELVPYYRRFGYVERGTREFPDGERTTKPCHFIVMRKPLERAHPMNAS